MMYSQEGVVHAYGSENVLRAEFSQLARCLAEKFGADKILESAVSGVYADTHAEVNYIHKIFEERGMNV